MTKVKDRLLLLDANSYFYRAFYALPYLTSPKGQPTGAIYGTVNMLLSLLKTYPSALMVAVFDGPGPKFRHQLLSSYKSHRPPMPQEMVAQLAITKEVIRAMGILVLEQPGLEADDVIASLAHLGKQHHLKVVISTGDKDLTQLVDSEVLVVDTMRRRIFDAKEVEVKFGVSPAQMTEYLMLLGDQSDEIPGVPGIGKVTAAKLLQTYGNLDNILRHLNELPAKAANALKTALEKDQFTLTRKLVSLKLAPLDLSLDDITIKPQDTTKLKELYQELGFHQWLKALNSAGAAEIESAPKTSQPAQQELQLNILDNDSVKVLSEAKTLSLFWQQLKTLDCCAMLSEDHFQSCKFYTGSATFKLDQPLTKAFWEQLAKFKELTLVVSESKAWWKFWLQNQLPAPLVIRDVQLMAYLNDNARRHYALDDLISDYVTSNASSKPAQLLELDKVLKQQLMARPINLKLLTSIDQPLTKVLAKMELAGVQLDAKELTDFSQELATKVAELAAEIYLLAGREFNLNSPKQLSEVLYQQLNLPALKKTATGLHSTAEAVLQRLAPKHPLIAKLLTYRTLMKIKSTYLDPLPKLISQEDHRIHTSYHQTAVLTGRLSSSDPNLQNIPIWSEEGQRIRKAFKAPPGKQLLTIDYSQIELRIMAHLAGDEALIKAFKDGDDVHQRTAAEILAKPLNQVTDLERRLAKTINFGLIYGMSAFGLADRLHIANAEAMRYVQRYFERFKNVKNYIDAVHHAASENGYVETMLGRRLIIPNLHAAKVTLKQAAFRVAVNATVQGSAAELIKLAMIAVQQWIEHAKRDVRMLMQVHDELIFEVADDDAAECSAKIQHLMETAYQLKVPLEAKAGLGKTWEQAKH